MGNSESSGEESYAQLISKYNVVKQFQDARLGDLTILQEQLTKQEVLLREINANDEFQFNQTMKRFQERQQLVHPNIIQLIGLTNQVDKQFCATFYQTYILFQYVTNNLEREIYARQTNNKHFAEGELFTLIQECVSAMAYLQSNNVQHQNIRPNTIYITQKGTIKMTDPVSFQQTHNFAALITQQGESSNQHFIYPSPLLMKALEKSDWNPTHNPYKSDVFTLGMTLLHAGILESMDTSYDFSNFRINEEIKLSQLSSLRLLYDRSLCDIIAEMIEWQEDRRPDFLQLQRMISLPSTPSNYEIPPPPRPPSPPPSRYVPPTPAPAPPPPVSISKPTAGAKTMTADQEDWVSSGLNGVPRDLISLKATPDENVGNDLGRGTVQDENPLMRDSQLPSNKASMFSGEKDPAPYQPFHQNPYEDLPPYSNAHHPLHEEKQDDHQFSPQVEKILSQYGQKGGHNPNDQYPSNYSQNLPFTSYQPPVTVPEYSTNVSDIFQKYGLNNNTYAPTNSNDYRPSAQSDIRPYGSNSSNFNPYNSNIAPTSSDPYRPSNIGSNIKPYGGGSHIPHREYVVQTYQNGSRYEGEKLDGMRDGRGKFFYQDGGMYHGEWKQNKMHGRGILYYSSGKPAYDGQWKNDLFEGRGILYNENPMNLPNTFDYRDFDLVDDYWIKYDGEFQDDNKEGVGTLYFSNEERFVGLFQKDFVNGPGTFYKKNAQIVKGTWRNNQLITETITYS